MASDPTQPPGEAQDSPDAGAPRRIPPVPPLAALVVALAGWRLPRPVGAGGRLWLQRLEATPEGLRLHLRVQGLGRLVDGLYPVGITVLDSTPDESLCRLTLPGPQGITRLLGKGLGFLPSDWINTLLGRFAGEAVRVEGATLRVRHRSLLRLLRKARPDAEPGTPGQGEGPSA